MSSKKLSLRLVIDTKRNKVLYAEAGNDVVDFLFSLLALPVGTVVELLNEKNKDNITCGMAKVYQSIVQLDENYLQTKRLKNFLLYPFIQSRVSINSFLLPNFVSDLYLFINTIKATTQILGRKFVDDTISEEDGIVMGLTTYMIADDLTVTPMSNISFFVILNRFNINDLGILEHKNIDLNFEKVLVLLKSSLQSKTVLSDVFLGMDKI